MNKLEQFKHVQKNFANSLNPTVELTPGEIAILNLLDARVKQLEQNVSIKTPLINSEMLTDYIRDVNSPHVQQVLRKKDNIVYDYETAYKQLKIDHEALVEQNRQMKAQLRVKKEIVNMQEGWVWTIDGVPMEDFVDERDNMKDQIKSFELQVKQEKNQVKHFKGKYQRLKESYNNLSQRNKRSNETENELHRKYDELVELYNIRGNELKSYEESHERNSEFANIGRVFKWYHTSCDQVLMANFGRITSRKAKFEMMFEAIEELYRKDQNNE